MIERSHAPEKKLSLAMTSNSETLKITKLWTFMLMISDLPMYL
jgi:hypothetical protein